MNRFYAFIIASAFFTSAEAKDVVIRISNSTDIQRHELVELDAAIILAEAGLDRGSLVVKNRIGQRLTLQYTYDGKLLFDASVRPHSYTEYTVTRGIPVVNNVWVKGRLVPERKDDIAWENDRCAYRVYGPALQKTGEKAFGIDIWVKNTPELVVDERYALDIPGFQETMRLKAAGKEEEAKENGLATTFHVDRGRGYDPYKVGPSLGCGTPALLLGDSLVMPYCWKEYEILDNGPLRFTVALTYDKAKDGSTEHRIISLDKGSNFNKMTVWYENLPQPTDVVGGVVIHEEDSTAFSVGRNYVEYADPTDDMLGNSSQVYTACVFPDGVDRTAYLPYVKPENGNTGHIVGIHRNLRSNERFTYYFGAAWSKYDVRSQNEWRLRIKEFADSKRHPLTIGDNSQEKRDSVLFRSEAIDKEIKRVQHLLRKNEKLAMMFGQCFPNTLETTVHYSQKYGDDDTFIYTGDIPAMWLRDSGAQVWPYVQFANKDEKLRKMLRGTILRQLRLICIDPYANAFNDGATGDGWQTDNTQMNDNVFERKYEIDSSCYPIRLAYEYWKVTGDTSVFGELWQKAVANILKVFRDQQRKDGKGDYRFLRSSDRAYDTLGWLGIGSPVNPVGLIASAFRPSDDATTLPFLVPSNFMAVSSLRKAAEILNKVNNDSQLAGECKALADEVHEALMKYAVVDHPKYGKVYAYEVDGFDNHLLMDDANVPSLLGMGYLGDVSLDDPVYQNTRRFVWSDDNPWFFRGKAGEGIGGPHVGYDMIWPMSIMMKAFTSHDDAEIRQCMRMLMTTDAGTGFMHESFHKDDDSNYTRPWFAWQNTLFGELVLKLIHDGKTDLLIHCMD